MRSYSLFTIVLLCMAIVLVDMLAFYWLRSITQPLPSPIFKTVIDVLFWTFTIGLVTTILIFKVKIDAIPVIRKHRLIASLYGLTVSSFIPKVIFTVVISMLYLTNYIFSETQSLYFVPLVGLLAGFLPFFVIVYGIFKALYNFKVHPITLRHKALPENFNQLKVVQLSDLHLGSFSFRYHLLDKLITVVNDWDADLILFTGDLVNNYSWELRGWHQVLSKLSAKTGKFAVLGNHDYGDYSDWDTPAAKKENFEVIKDFFKQIDFKLLLNESVTLTRNNEEIAIIGLENWGSPPFPQYGDLKKAMVEVKTVPFKVLLSHDPSHWDAEVASHTDIALTLAGHTHGMQVGVTLGGKQWSPIKYKYKQWAGLYSKDDQYLYVTRGLGWLGFPGRLGMRPEITFITLEKT